jgi:hypothetical protein
MVQIEAATELEDMLPLELCGKNVYFGAGNCGFGFGFGQLPSAWQGTGTGSNKGPWLLVVRERCTRGICAGAEENEAEARPMTATSRVKVRIASFIFSNSLIGIKRKGNLSFIGG